MFIGTTTVEMIQPSRNDMFQFNQASMTSRPYVASEILGEAVYVSLKHRKPCKDHLHIDTRIVVRSVAVRDVLVLVADRK